MQTSGKDLPNCFLSSRSFHQGDASPCCACGLWPVHTVSGFGKDWLLAKSRARFLGLHTLYSGNALEGTHTKPLEQCTSSLQQQQQQQQQQWQQHCYMLCQVGASPR
jgi:hypothetical protein